MRTHIYPSDISDAQWALIEPHLPVHPGGRPRKTNLRDVLDAIFYILRTGCRWRDLPKDFPPKGTVWRYFHEWRHDGIMEKAQQIAAHSSPRTTTLYDRTNEQITLDEAETIML